MAYRFNAYDNSLTIDGWEHGIGDSYYTGLGNVSNANISTVPGEVCVAPKTVAVLSTPSYSGITVTAVGDSASVTVPNSQVPLLETNQAVYFSSSSITGVGTGTAVYWLYSVSHGTTNCVFGIQTGYGTNAGAGIGNTGTAVMFTFNPVFNARANLSKNYLVGSAFKHWALDSNGLVWSDIVKTTTTQSWTYTGNLGNAGNSPDATANGNGMAYMQTGGGGATVGALEGWLFIWRNSAIDYLNIEDVNGSAVGSATLSWVYGWNPATGTVNQSNYLTTGNIVASHEAIITPDGRCSYCDGYIIGRFYQTAVGTTFNPQSTATYTFNTFPILSIDDAAQCLAYLGVNLLIGGKKNAIYSWDLVNTQYSPPLILLPEANIKNLVTVNLKTYVFAGNRGNIYITNGSQADWFAKVPDFLSGTVQPTYVWGGATFTLNTLYFGVYALATGTSIPILSGYGGIWGINLVNGAKYISNKLSGGADAFVSALFATRPSATTAFNGYELYATYGNGTSQQYGIDGPSALPYTDGTTILESELIPIGTLNIPRNFMQIEYKLAKPLVSGESIQVLYRKDFSQSYTSIFTDSTVGNLSATKPINFANAQWVQFRTILTSTASSPSYVRLKELRLIGLTRQVPA